MKKVLAAIIMMAVIAAGGSTVMAASTNCPYDGSQPQDGSGMQYGKEMSSSFVCRNPDCLNYGRTVTRQGDGYCYLSETGQKIFCQNVECPNAGVCPQDGTGMKYGKQQSRSGYAGHFRRNRG